METLAAEKARDPKVSTASLLVVDDEESTRQVLRAAAEDAGFFVQSAATTEEALAILDRQPVDIVITDLKVPKLGGWELLQQLRVTMPHVAVIVLTQYGSIESAIELTRMGAADYVTKPFNVADVKNKLEHIAHSLELDQENRVLREQLKSRPGFGGLIGVSPKMQRVYKLIEKVSGHNYPVLILGESGTGKELVARSIHFMGKRRAHPFVPVDCSALVSTLIESELFGYVKGAFTGAQHNNPGYWRQPARERSFSMRSVTFRLICRPSCCGRFRNTRSGRWAAMSACHCRRASSPRRTQIWKRGSAKANSGRTSISG